MTNANGYDKSYADMLRGAKDRLTADNWSKGNYFSSKDGTLCMCAHGALQAECNPEVIKAITACTSGRTERSPAGWAAGASAAEVVAAGMAATTAAEVGSAHACRRAHPRAEEAAAGASAAKAPRAAMAATTAEAAAYLAAPSSAAKALALSVEVDIADIFSNRPAWCADRLRYDGKDLGDLTAHYIAGMVGLTADFNDAEDTTLADVLAKFDEAIKLAEELGV